MELSVEAKKEYVNMLCNIMSPIMTETFVNMYKEAITRSNRHRDKVLQIFIILCEEITNWNNSIISTHTKEYETKCPYFSDLLAAVFVCYVKILSSIKIKKESKKLSIKLPSNSDFIHSCLVNCGKMFIENPMIFREDNQRIREESIRRVCDQSIEKALNDLIPIQQILRTYIIDTSAFDIGEEEAVPEFISQMPEEPTQQEEPEEEEQQEESPVLFEDATEKNIQIQGEKKSEEVIDNVLPST